MTEIPKISLEYRSLNEADTSTVLEFYKRLIEQGVQQGLSLTRLDEIVICEDFQSRVFSFQQSVGIPPQITSEPEYACYGKTVWYSRSGHGMRAKIFIDANLGLALGQSGSPARHLLIHELGHVHDDSYIIEQFGHIDTPSLNRDPKLISLALSRYIWNEYHAEFIALKVDTKLGFRANFESLKSIQDRTVSAVTSAHSQYQRDTDIFHLWSTIVTQSSIHLQAVGRIAPYVQFLLANDTKESVEDSFDVFRSISCGLIGELKSLMSHYRQWNTWSWARLQKYVSDMWQLCGVKAEAINSGCYVHVLVPPSLLFR